MKTERGFLVVSRKQGDEIWIGSEVRIVIKHIASKVVSIGIEAPKDLKINRPDSLKKRGIIK